MAYTVVSNDEVVVGVDGAFLHTNLIHNAQRHCVVVFIAGYVTGRVKIYCVHTQRNGRGRNINRNGLRAIVVVGHLDVDIRCIEAPIDGTIVNSTGEVIDNPVLNFCGFLTVEALTTIQNSRDAVNLHILANGVGVV
ncbi:hypothetical protein [Collinsella intestinalis]|uniref:hypothetical protein n=1 Tax=Collinsella intestinalis TaxID=147207 RepID=UPI0025A40C71|nr:hypothetical protein [Collinsella intestinalis]